MRVPLLVYAAAMTGRGRVVAFQQGNRITDATTSRCLWGRGFDHTECPDLLLGDDEILSGANVAGDVKHCLFSNSNLKRKLGPATLAASTALVPPLAAMALDGQIDASQPVQIVARIEHIIEISLCIGALLTTSSFVMTKNTSMNNDALTQKAKIVLIQPDPYGLEAGRRYFNGVMVADVKEYCNGGKVDNECAETINGFLGDVNSNNGDEPSAEQKETANAVLSYLDSLSSAPTADRVAAEMLDSSRQQASMSFEVSKPKTSEAFSSYLGELSKGNVSPPTDAQSVVSYLESLEGRLDKLETTIADMPDQIVSKMDRQNDNLADEFAKINSHLVNAQTGQQQPRIPGQQRSSLPLV